MAADLSGFLTAAALGAVYLLLLRRRALQRAAPEQLPVAVLALLLAILAFGKVLSPQYVIWIVPVLALVAVSDQLLAGLTALVLLLTHIEFPALYIQLVELTRGRRPRGGAQRLCCWRASAVACGALSGWGSEAALRKARGLKMPAARRGSPF